MVLFSTFRFALSTNIDFPYDQVKYSRYQFNKIGHRVIFKDRKGILFIQNGWGPTDHIDLWNGNIIKNGSLGYFNKGVSIWFWDLI